MIGVYNTNGRTISSLLFLLCSLFLRLQHHVVNAKKLPFLTKRTTGTFAANNDKVRSLVHDLVLPIKGGDDGETKKKKKWDNDDNWFPGKTQPIDGCVRVSYDYMYEFMMDVFNSYDIVGDDATIAATVLIEADKRGIYSHGIGRLKPIYCDRMDWGILYPHAKMEIENDHGAVAMVNGNLGLGLVIGPYCMDLAIKKAKEYGVGVVVAKNSTHYGIAGYYATMATEAGCIGFSTTNARPSIAPTYGVQGMLGTNPLCFGIPTDEKYPFVIDCATSVNQRGKIEKYARDGQPTPPGQVVDNKGNIRTDTDEILKDLVTGKAALCPVGGAGDEMGGYKGYGWALAAELLCTAFQQGPFGDDITGVDKNDPTKKASMSLGHIFIAIDVTKFGVPLAAFQNSAGNLLRWIRSGNKDPNGPGKIWTPGEPEYDHRTQTMKKESESATTTKSIGSNGAFMIPPALQNDMKQLRDEKRFSEELKKKYSKFEWEE